MRIKLSSEEKARVETGYRGDNCVDITSGGWEQALEISFFSSRQYLEIRKKEDQICSFYFEMKSHKKDYNFGWWEDAEVIFAVNNVDHNH